MGKLKEAEPLLQRALESYEAKLGKSHPDTLQSVNNLGLLLKAQGKLNEAEPLLRRAVEGREATLGERHPDTLASVSSLALLRKEMIYAALNLGLTQRRSCEHVLESTNSNRVDAAIRSDCCRKRCTLRTNSWKLHQDSMCKPDKDEAKGVKGGRQTEKRFSDVGTAASLHEPRTAPSSEIACCERVLKRGEALGDV
jgi:tetratricopeptide (TPR) repeat protein